MPRSGQAARARRDDKRETSDKDERGAVMNPVERAKNIILSPATEWPTIAAEESSVQAIYTGYLVVLAAIPAVAGFIGMTLIGFGAMGMGRHMSLGGGLLAMVVGYLISLLLVYLVAWVVDALAPSFRAQKNFLNAFKLVAYSATPGMVAGVLQILPMLAPITLLASLYGIYELYLGLPVLMKVPQERAILYAAAIVVATLIIGIVLSRLVAGLFSAPVVM